MVNSSILDGRTNVKIEASSGNIVAHGGNYILNAAASHITNYAREGADLVLEFADGQHLVIRDFFLGGSGYNNLLLADGSTMQLVDFSSAFGGADGINDAALAYDAVAAGGANAALLGLLGLAAAGAGVAGLAGGGSDKKDSDKRVEGKIVNENLDSLKNLLNKEGSLTKEDLDKAKGYLEHIHKDMVKIKDIDGLGDILAAAQKKFKDSDFSGTADDAIKTFFALKTAELLNNELAKGGEANDFIIKAYIASIHESMDSIKNVDGMDVILNELSNKAKDTDYADSVDDIITGTAALRAVDQLNEILLNGKDGFRNAGDIIKLIKATGHLPTLLENASKGISAIRHIESPENIEEKIKIVKAIKALDALAVEFENLQDNNHDGKIDVRDIKNYQELLKDLKDGMDSIKDIDGVKEIANKIDEKIGAAKDSGLDGVKGAIEAILAADEAHQKLLEKAHDVDNVLKDVTKIADIEDDKRDDKKAAIKEALKDFKDSIDAVRNADNFNADDIAKIKAALAKVDAVEDIDIIDGVTEVKTAMKNVVAKDDFNKILEKIGELDPKDVANANDDIKEILKDFDVDDIKDIKGINIDGIEKDAKGIESVKKIVAAINDGKSVEEIKTAIDHKNPDNPKGGLGKPLTEGDFYSDDTVDDDLNLDDYLTSDNGAEQLPLEGLFSTTGEVQAFDMPALPLVPQEDFATNIMLASQIIV